MKMSKVMIVLTLAIMAVLIAGCASFGGSTPTPTVSPTSAGQSGSVVPAPGTATAIPSLTDVEKEQAEYYAKANETIKSVLSQPGYTVAGVDSTQAPAGSNDRFAMVSIVGQPSISPDGSMWTPDQYIVIVDVTKDKVTSIVHIEPKPLPKPP